MTLQLAGTWEGHNQGLLTLTAVRWTYSSYLACPDKTKVHDAWQTVWRLLKEMEECATLHGKQRMIEMWSLEMWKALIASCIGVLKSGSDRTDRWSQKSVSTRRGLAHRRWPKSPAFPLFPFEYLLLPPLGEQWCRRTLRHFQLFRVPSSGDKAPGWKEHCSDKQQKSCLLILSSSACHSTELLFNC